MTPRPCIFAPWADWEAPTCAGLCFRQRVVLQNSNMKTPCNGPLADTKVCPKLCNKPVDCELSMWKPWTMCIAHHAQRYRERRISKFPRFDGKTCSGMHVLNETTSCEVVAVRQDCMMTSWSLWTPCEKTCGAGGWQKRIRHIQTPAAAGGTPCSGNTEEMRGCNEIPCVGKDGCDLNDWGDWSECRQYTSQRYRKRVPNPTSVCRVHLEEVAPCDPWDCQLSAWSDWNECPVSCDGGYHERSRHVQAEAVRGGKPCSPTLKEVQPCGEANCDPNAPAIFACAVSSWTMWTGCSVSCGSGYEDRSRTVTHLRSEGGPGCNQAVVQNRTCHTSACPSPDCKWADWSIWSACTRTCGNGTAVRKRIMENPPRLGGKPCAAINTEEVKACQVVPCQDCIPVDAEWSQWSTWGYCTSTCRGGLSWRSRTIAKEMSPCGQPAKGLDKEYKSCNEDAPCGGDVDCELGQWEPWSDCSASCDGVASRSRRIVTMGRGGGKHCTGAVEETTSCRPAPEDLARPLECQAAPKEDCVFSEWEQGPCTVSCGGGSALVKRHIQAPARGGGTPCKGPIFRTMTCGQTECPGITRTPCTWSDWENWGKCDTSNGERKRFRHIATMPTDGQVCEPGDSEEVQACSVDGSGPYCGWADWGAWSNCSKDCNLGMRHRRRNLTELSVPPQAALPVIYLNGQTTPKSLSTIKTTTTVKAPSATCTNSGKCYENGAPDPDCCADPHAASCAPGYSYTKGDLCYGQDLFRTCCTPSTSPLNDFSPGQYYVNHPVAVTLTMDTGSKMVGKLQASQFFNVVEVKSDENDYRIRGRLEEPAGWISLKNLQTGHVWAHRADQAAGIRKYFDISLHGTQHGRARDLSISFFCGLCSVLAVALLVRRLASSATEGFSRPQRNLAGSEGAASDEQTAILRP